MSTFFSGTDMQELHDNASSYPYYLSLIVNFAGNYCAKIAFVAKRQATVSTVGAITCKENLNNVQLNVNNSSQEVDEEVLITVDCNIQFEENPDGVPEYFKNKLTELKNKPTRYSYTSNRHTNYSPGGTGGTFQSWWEKEAQQKREESFTQKDEKAQYLKMPYFERKAFKVDRHILDITDGSIANFLANVLDLKPDTKLSLYAALREADMMPEHKKEKHLDKIEDEFEQYAVDYFLTNEGDSLDPEDFHVIASCCVEFLSRKEYDFYKDFIRHMIRILDIYIIPEVETEDAPTIKQLELYLNKLEN